MRNLGSLTHERTRLSFRGGIQYFFFGIGLVVLFVLSGRAGEVQSVLARQERIVVGGMVADSSGQPIAGASIAVRNATVPEAYFGRTGDDGRFEVERGGRTGLVEVVAYADGYGVGVKRYRLEKGEDLLHLLFKLEDAAFMRGVVVDEFAQPIPNAKIELRYQRPVSRLIQVDLGNRKLRTDPVGIFSIRNVQPRVPFQLLVLDESSGRLSDPAIAPDILQSGQFRDGVVISATLRQRP